MSSQRFQSHRQLLKDSIRQRVDFSQTPQRLGEPPPPLQQPYAPELSLIPLPDGAQCMRQLATLSVAEAIAQRQSHRNFAPQALSLEQLSALLWASQGVRKVLSASTALRTVPSAGARHPFESYLAIRRVDGLTPGLYRYLPFGIDSDPESAAQLVLLREMDDIGLRAADACYRQSFVALAGLSIFWTAIPVRGEWRYDLAAHKVIAIDAGHVCQNVYLAAEAMGLGCCAIAAYDQGLCDRLLGVDGDEEFTIYIAALGVAR
ncbi:MAG: SagB/ThcOx family dehydrogenase [Myxococcota bacterium]|jgi:SagB-type dehydrogenase family enzyme|nr:SagB/ThcOx family dehydrogenase [Myxococcota bacterium]